MEPISAEWNHVSSHEVFYAGDKRPFSFPLAYEGSEAALEQTVIAKAAVNAYCPGSNSWRVLRAEDEVLLHVIDTSADADADNDGGFAPDDPDAYTLADQWLEWAHQQYNREVPGKLGTINDGDLDFLATGDGMPDYADGFDWFSGPDSDPRDDRMMDGDETDPTLHQFVPVKLILPGRSGSSNQRIRFWFEYDSADPTYFGNDPQDLQHWYDGELQRHYWELGAAGSMRLWTEPAHVRRNWWGINEEEARPGESTSRGHFIDSTEWDSSSAAQEPVYYTHEDFFGDDAQTAWAGGEVTLFLELLRPSAVLAGSSIKLHVTYEQFDAQSNMYAPYGFSYMQLVPLTGLRGDLSIDSFNDSGFSAPPANHTEQEDAAEDRPGQPGKFIALNDDDTDNDGVIDWADFDGIAGEQFVPLLVTLPPDVDLTGATIRFDYEASDPAGVLQHGSGTAQDPYWWELAPDNGQGAPDALRLWNKPGAEARSPLQVGHVSNNNEEGSFIRSGIEYPVALLFPSGARQAVLWVEAVRLSAALGDLRIVETVTLSAANNPGLGQATIPPDAVRLTAGKIDLDIDSDNNNAFALPGRTKDEDQIEARSDLVGKVVLVNRDDDDRDDLPDYVDFHVSAAPGAPNPEAEQFVPLSLELPGYIDPTKATVKFEYSGSDPLAALVQGVWPNVRVTLPTTGYLRLWAKPGTEARDPNPIALVPPQSAPGDYIAPEEAFGADLLTYSDNIATVWLEAVKPGAQGNDRLIRVLIDPDGNGPSGFAVSDEVRVTTVDFDLDVDGNLSLNDVADRAENYVPGYRRKIDTITSWDPDNWEAVLSTGTTFNTPDYVGQLMNVVLDGLGENMVDRVLLEIIGATNAPGFAGNATHANIEGTGKDSDVSFTEVGNEHGTPDPWVALPQADLHFANIWVKDYGAAARIRVKAEVGTNVFTIAEIDLATDYDNDNIADLWERLQVRAWNQQYGTTEDELASFFDAADDKEPKDPDGTTEALGFTPGGPGAPANRNEHLTEGDGKDVRAEYRGFILDGGGFDPSGQNGHSGGHARLTASWKELLVEVDAMEGTTHMPNRAGIAVWMDAVSVGTMQAANGAGFRTFYVLDDLATPHTTFVAPVLADQHAAVHAYLGSHAHAMLAAFRHLHLVDEFDGQTTSGWTWDDVGASYAVDQGFVFAGSFTPSIAYNTSSSSYISHELHHVYVTQAGDDGNEHFNDTNGNGTPAEADDMTRILWNYSLAPSNADAYRQIKYGLGSTRFISIR